MGNAEDRAFVFDQVLLEPRNGFRVEVVGRFVEQKHIRCFEQEFTQRHTATFTAREVRRHRIIWRTAQCFHRHVHLAVEVPEVLAVDLVLKTRHFVGGLVRVVHREFVVAVQNGLFLSHTQHHVVTHRQRFIELRFLRQVADLCAFCGPCLAREILVPASHDFKKRRFTGAVDTDNTDFNAGKEVETDVLKDLLPAWVGLGHAVHEIDKLVAGHWVIL